MRRSLRTGGKIRNARPLWSREYQVLRKTKAIELSHEEAIYLACHLRERTGVSYMEHLAQPEMYRRMCVT